MAEPDDDWRALHDTVLQLVGIVHVFDWQAHWLDDAARQSILDRLEQDTREAATLAAFLAARAREGGDPA